jgi:hypothetical protein
MPLDEYQYYIKLYNEKADREREEADQAERRARMNSARQDGKPIGEVIPHPPRAE